jgi:DNA-binding response OmpR family regulator
MIIINVDDDSDDSEMFVNAVAELDPGITCISLDSGIKLLKFLSTTETLPDFIFMDFNMPKVNGYDSAKSIRSMKKLDAIPIIMHSTSFSPGDTAKFAALGCKCLVKQSHFDDLVQSIKALVF